MIIKNLSWHRFNPRSLIRYISESDKTMEPNDPIYWNLLGKSEAEIIEEFEVNHQYRSTRKNSVMLHHDIISFSPQDAPHLNQDKIRDLTYQYLELRAKNNLAFAHIHRDKKHYHVHIMISPNPLQTEKLTQIKRKEYFDIRRNLEAYQIQQYPELSNSILFIHQQNPKRISNKAYELKKRNGVLDKDSISSLVSSAFKSSYSLVEFHNKVMQFEGCELYTRGGRYYGVLFNGKKYRFTTLLSLTPDQIKESLEQKEKSIVDDLISKAAFRTKKTKSRERDR